MSRIVFIGAGAIGTSLGNILAAREDHTVTLHTVENRVLQDISGTHINSRYFPTIRLHPKLRATGDNGVFKDADVLFLAIPSAVMMDYLHSIQEHIPGDTLLVNLAKGFGCDQKPIPQCIRDKFPNPVSTLKGPSFARDIINRIPTAFTIGSENPACTAAIRDVFRGTTIHLDETTDVTGVEILSILKNIYAIAIGIADAQFDSPNLRFMLLGKAFREMRRVLIASGGNEETLFRYCGYGDFTLTSLNDLSRNRTLGLLIGKGFFTENVSHGLVLEGITAVNIFYEKLSGETDISREFPIIGELWKIFNTRYDIPDFVKNILDIEEA
jgi:glycerol-3-phosphate dehydrogenase (NAD(P)+)